MFYDLIWVSSKHIIYHYLIFEQLSKVKQFIIWEIFKEYLRYGKIFQQGFETQFL